MRQTRKLRISLFTQIALLISVAVFASLCLFWSVFSLTVDQLLARYIGQQALTVAKMTAQDPRIAAAFEAPDPSAVIQPIAEAIRKETGASYVVVGNKEGIRYSHPDPARIGKKMEGGDNAPVLKGESIISEAVGSLGPSLRGKTPVRNGEGEIVGIVSVGFLVQTVHDLGRSYQSSLYGVAILLVVLGCAGAYLIARRVKTLILGLEPEQISFLYRQREAAFESIRDAIVAVDMQQQVINMNKRARELLGPQRVTVGSKLSNPNLQTVTREALESRQGVQQGRVFLGGRLYALTAMPIIQGGEAIGVVFTIYTVSEIERLTDEFSKIKAFSDNMRAQNHEYLNKLNTIYGLLALRHYDKAMELITDEVKERQDVIAFLVASVKDPLIAACLLGKINRAKELKAGLVIDPDSRLLELPEHVEAKSLVTIIGNIIDNGLEAALELRSHEAEVRVSFTDFGNDIIFDIEDNGPGIPQDKTGAIFADGYSSKKGGSRGLGLALVKHELEALRGAIYIDKSHTGGARFTVVIPKYPSQSHQKEGIHHESISDYGHDRGG
ncbi:ATP-binding protein [Paenibacillus thailandensis]|uniref:histidine kinase n=1 Tax=Paenibacillus thailandensis TaxID=393250 RepID=A0ABW5QVM8_9BACL